jgi:hypothetical protein
LLLTAALSVVGGLLFGAVGPAAACSCAALTDEEAFEYADAVFTGTLVEVITGAGHPLVSTDPARFMFDVDRVFKGDVFAPSRSSRLATGGVVGSRSAGRVRSSCSP